jgi:anthranilate synthase component 1
VIVFDHLYRRIHFLSHQPLDEAQQLWIRFQAKLNTSPALTPLSGENSDDVLFEKTHGPFTQESFCQGVEHCKTLIREGELFQIVLSQRFSMPVTTDPINIYRVIRAINPSPYSYFLKFPQFVYLGASPETFARCENGQMTVKVLAGTRPRGLTDKEDEALMQSLIADEKELAEHRMLVDLGRNDLGRVCEPGSIQLGDIATVTRYTHVMHLATRVSGKLKTGKTAFDAFQSVFPRGTVSGAPKIRAMQHLAKLEPEQRGIYAGAVGYFDFNGNMDSAIAIRSVLVKDGQAHVNAGAGIVYDSDPISEYMETRNKAKSILKAVQLAEGETHR